MIKYMFDSLYTCDIDFVAAGPKRKGARNTFKHITLAVPTYDICAVLQVSAASGTLIQIQAYITYILS